MDKILHFSFAEIVGLKKALPIFVLMCLHTATGKCQVSLSSASPSSTENFNGMGTGTTLPANWRIMQGAIPTWAGGITTLGTQASSGSPTTGTTYNWGTTGATDRAAGVMTSGSYASPNSLMAFYTNADANTISEINISYTAERYRKNSAAASVQFYYSTDGSTWTAVTAGDITAGSFPTGTSSYTFSSPLTVNASATIAISIAAGGNFYLRWNLNTTGANSQGIGIDNVVVSAIFTVNGSYRSASTGTWAGTATWQRFTAGAWNPSAAPDVNNTTDNIYIRHAISSGGSISAGKIIIENGGTLTYTASSTCGTSMLVKNGGILQINAALSMTGASFTVESGGRVNLNHANTNGTSPLWGGTENFQSGSIFEIQNWDYAATGGDNRLVQNPSIISANSTGGYYFGNLIISGTPSQIFIMSEGNQTINLCENDFTSSAIGNNVAFTNVASNVTVGGNVIATAGTFSFAATTSGNPVSTVLGNIQPTGGTINLNQDNSGTATSTVQLKGNINIPTGATLTSTDAGCKIVFSGTGIQTISIAGTLNVNVEFEVENGATTQLINQNLNLANATNDFRVLAGGTHEFNGFDIIGPGVFDLQARGTIKITSPNGVNATGATGNVQTNSRAFSQTGYYHYVGSRTPQSTGTAITAGSTAKRIIIEKTNATDIVNLTQSTGIATSGNGRLEIIQGIFTESPTSVITGSGDLVMSGGEYRMSVLSTTLPQLTGAYTLSGGTITLNGAGNQVLRGARDYRNVSFTTSGIKTVTSAPNSITGTITVADAAVLNVDNNTMGGAGTNLTMIATSRYITAGTGTKPDAQGTYSLAAGTTIEFRNNAATMQEVRLSPAYYNIDVSGSNVGNSSLVSGITMQSGSSFTVTPTGVFKLQNSNGFTGSANTAINTSTNPTINLQTGSTVEYYGSASQIFSARTDYQNVIISGGGGKTLNGASVINGLLTLTNGLVTTSGANMLSISATGSATAGSTSSFVNGPMRKTGNTAFIFPVGKFVSGIGHHRTIGIGNLSGSETFTAEFMRANARNLGPVTATGLQRVSQCEYWTLDRLGASVTADVTLTWTAQSPCNVSYVTQPSTTVVAHFNGTSWDSYGGSGTGSPSPGSGSATWTNVGVFSPFALGSTSVAENPLPFNLSTFNGIKTADGISLSWVVSNNHEQQEYVLEYSTDGVHYQVLTSLLPKSNLQIATYQYVHQQPRIGWNYYRLRAKDIRGAVHTSHYLKINYGNENLIIIGPNPTREKIVINLSNPSSILQIDIVNIVGQRMMTTRNISFSTIFNTSHLQAGMYYIWIYEKNGRITKPFVKE